MRYRVQDRVTWDHVTTAVDVRATTPSCASVRAVSRELDVNTVSRLRRLSHSVSEIYSNIAGLDRGHNITL